MRYWLQRSLRNSLYPLCLFLGITQAQAQSQCQPLDVEIKQIPAGAKWQLYGSWNRTKAQMIARDASPAGIWTEADKIILVELADKRIGILFIKGYAVCHRVIFDAKHHRLVTDFILGVPA